GSIVLAEKLRFDFSHGKPIEADNLRRIESIVNEQIKAELDVSAKSTLQNHLQRHKWWVGHQLGHLERT
ncbi:hypothetical protein HKB06_24685, partial [Vibrio parahaemolyticus]|nr:hypothetical protein [Vibrio parahaemolyticus]